MPGSAPLSKTVLIIDEEDAFISSLERSFRDLGFEIHTVPNYAAAKMAARRTLPLLILTELRVEGTWAFQAIEDLRRQSPDSHIAILTTFPSVATAVHSVRLGFSEYLVKPVTAREVLDLVDSGFTLEPPVNPAPAWPSLDRTIWEHINQVFVSAGSMSEAARRLHLDRRSLRRMLAKYPPHR